MAQPTKDEQIATLQAELLAANSTLNNYAAEVVRLKDELSICQRSSSELAARNTFLDTENGELRESLGDLEASLEACQRARPTPLAPTREAVATQALIGLLASKRMLDATNVVNQALLVADEFLRRIAK